ncbi:hypothetical protein PENTCL1PPCAC_730, partial [Pristionchus entomophagus]
MIDNYDRKEVMKPLFNFSHLMVGNQISIRSFDQIWFQDMLARFLANETSRPILATDLIYPIANDIFHSSAHEKSLRDSIETFVPTTKNIYWKVAVDSSISIDLSSPWQWNARILQQPERFLDFIDKEGLSLLSVEAKVRWRFDRHDISL